MTFASRQCRPAPRTWAWLALPLSAALLAAQTTPTFRTEVALVHADAEVVEDGRILTGFTKDDFRILDEGKPQPIVQFSAGDQALDLILLFDISGSMKMAVSAVAAAARQALEELRPGDRVSVMVFNRKSREIAPFTTDLEAVRKTVQQDLMALHFGGGTLIQAAVDEAAHRFLRESRSERRRAVLIVTDNVGTRTRSEKTVVRDFWEADALLSGLIVSSAFRTINTVHNVVNPLSLAMQAGMKGIAEKTGGDAISSKDAGAAFTESMHRIRSRYSLYYAQPSEAKPGTTRTIRIELTGDAAKQHPKARVRARTGYVVPKS